MEFLRRLDVNAVGGVLTRETDSESIEDPQEQARSATGVDATQRSRHGVDRPGTDRLGWKRKRRFAHEAQIEEIGGPAERHVGQDASRQVRGSDPVTRVPEPVENASSESGAEEGRESGRRADRPAPGERELEPIERGEVALERAAQLGVVGLGMVVARFHAVAAVVLCLARAPQDAVVACQAVVIEEAPSVADSLTA